MIEEFCSHSKFSVGVKPVGQKGRQLTFLYKYPFVHEVHFIFSQSTFEFTLTIRITRIYRTTWRQQTIYKENEVNMMNYLNIELYENDYNHF